VDDKRSRGGPLPVKRAGWGTSLSLAASLRRSSRACCPRSAPPPTEIRWAAVGGLSGRIGTLTTFYEHKTGRLLLPLLRSDCLAQTRSDRRRSSLSLTIRRAQAQAVTVDRVEDTLGTPKKGERPADRSGASCGPPTDEISIRSALPAASADHTEMRLACEPA
jgi:hypothetical protein